ncbi:hypothetical protein [Nocardiopsis ansamitocini]|uniref:Uncharacterized protein n=1 Tax=Nocardiopsis ansamitocini TaxID=1670832 RepID=A0A9W6P7L5_9ACTN|nr:hypothetical protein [Nocardiopsis ansamitocini]GLU48660.1 hypothetical protein Nans01_30110 [Nocardiopsis ansamitocini]
MGGFDVFQSDRGVVLVGGDVGQDEADAGVLAGVARGLSVGVQGLVDAPGNAPQGAQVAALRCDAAFAAGHEALFQ